MNKNTFKILLSFLAVYIIWGSTYLAIKVIVETGPPFISMGLRFSIAALLIYAFLLIKGKFRMTKKQIINNSLIGVMLFAGGNGMVAWAEKYIPSGIASVIFSLLPLWFLIFDRLLNKAKKPSAIVWLGVFIGFAGILLLVVFKDLTSMKNISYLPFIIMILASIIWSFAAVLSPKLDKTKSGLLNLSVQMFAGGIVNVIIGILTKELRGIDLQQVLNLESIAALIYLILFGSIIALSAFTYLIENVSPGLVSTYSYVNPVVALFLGWLILKEEINSQIIIASALILLGVACIKVGNSSIKLIPAKKRFHKGIIPK